MEDNQNTSTTNAPTPLSQKVTVLVSAALGIIIAVGVSLPKLRITRQEEPEDAGSED